MSTPCPFHPNQPINGTLPPGRKELLRRVRDRVLDQSVITVLVSPFPNGKSSLLRALHSDLSKLANPRLLLGRVTELDHGERPQTSPEFWKRALPSDWPQLRPDDPLAIELAALRVERFDAERYDRLQALLQSANRVLVVLIDDLHLLAARDEPLMSSAFLGGLRAFFQRGGRGAMLVATSAEPVELLQERFREVSNGGSPFLNHVVPEPLDRCDPLAAEAWLGRVARRLAPLPLVRASGAQPWLLQVVGHAFWEAGLNQHTEVGDYEAPLRALLDKVAGSCARWFHEVLTLGDRVWLLRRALVAAGLDDVRPIDDRGTDSAAVVPRLAEIMAQGLGIDQLRRVAEAVGGAGLRGSLPAGDASIIQVAYALSEHSRNRGLLPELQGTLATLPALHAWSTDLEQMSTASHRSRAWAGGAGLSAALRSATWLLDGHDELPCILMVGWLHERCLLPLAVGTAGSRDWARSNDVPAQLADLLSDRLAAVPDAATRLRRWWRRALEPA